MDANWADVPGFREDDPAHKVIERYARLSPFELRTLRDQLFALAEQAGEEQSAERFEPEFGEKHCRRLAGMCERVLSWHPYATEWDWDYIIGNTTLRGHAKRIQTALLQHADEDLKDILRRAQAIFEYDPEAHRSLVSEFKRNQFGANDFVAEMKTIEGAYGDGDEYHTVYRAIRRAGWPGITQGTREELEKLTEAIKWATPGH